MASSGKQLSSGESSLNNSMNFGRPQSALSSQSYDDNVSMSGPIIKKDDQQASFWVKTKFFIRSMWATRQTEQENLANREIYIKTALRELIVYLFFLVFLSLLAFGMVSTNQFLMTEATTNTLVRRLFPNGYTNFDSMVTVNDYWMWLNSIALDSLYQPYWYNSDPVTPSGNWMLYNNKMLGPARIRQLRSSPNRGCKVPSVLAGYITFCYGSVGQAGPDTNFTNSKPTGSVITGLGLSVNNVTAWDYANGDSGIGYAGLVGFYHNGGFSQLLPSQTLASKYFQLMQNSAWIDRGTRAVIVEFTVYNADVNLFSFVQIVAEMPPSGGVVPSYQVRTVKLLRYVSTFDYFLLACEILYLIFVFYYIVEESLEIKKLKWDYFKSFWSWLDMTIIVVSLLLAIFTIYRTVSVGDTINSLISNPDKYADFSFLAFCQSQYQNVLAITVFFAYLKVFKYVSFNTTMKKLQATFSKCAGELFCFSIMFFVAFLAYAQFGFLLFSATVNSYKTFGDSICALFRTLLGDFDFDGMYRTDSFIGPIYFISFVFFMYFILLQMFLAIINDAYATVRAEFAMAKATLEVGQYLRGKWAKMMEKLNLKKKEIKDIQDAINEVSKDGKIDFVEMRAVLKRRGYADAEVEAVFARYDVHGNRKLDEKDLLKLQDGLERDKQNVESEINAIGGSGRGTTYKEYNLLVQRVEGTESAISKIVAKIDTVLHRMGLLEHTKASRREALKNVLDTMNSIKEEGGDDEERRMQLDSYVQTEIEKWDDEKARQENPDADSDPFGGSFARGSTRNSSRSSARTRSGRKK